VLSITHPKGVKQDPKFVSGYQSIRPRAEKRKKGPWIADLTFSEEDAGIMYMLQKSIPGQYSFIP
jgi:hypothetical protein